MFKSLYNIFLGMKKAKNYCIRVKQIPLAGPGSIFEFFTEDKIINVEIDHAKEIVTIYYLQEVRD